MSVHIITLSSAAEHYNQKTLLKIGNGKMCVIFRQSMKNGTKTNKNACFTIIKFKY